MERSTSRPWNVPGKYNVSPYNFVDEVLSDYNFPSKLPICDGTVRKMDATPGSVIPFPIEDKLEIAALLDEIGVAEYRGNPMHFYGTPRNEAICEGVRAVAKKGFKFKMTASMWWDSWVEGQFERHADRVIDMGVQTVDVEFPGSENFRQMYLRDWSWEQLLDGMARALEYVRSKGVEAGVLLSDGARGDLDEIITRMNFWIDHGVADRLYICDSFGCLSPPGTRYFVKRLRSELRKEIPIVYHTHDDFGLATAQGLAAAAAGAWPESSSNGVGDRAFLKMEEYVLSLELLYGVDTGIKLEKLSELSRLVERVTGITTPPNKPITGQTMYVPNIQQEYIDLFQGGPWTSTAFAPEMVGQKRGLVWWEGMLSPATVRAKLDQLELRHTEEQVDRAVEAIRSALGEIKQFPWWIADDEVAEICRHSLR